MCKTIDDDLFQVWKILLISKDSFLYSKYLHNPDTEEELTYINKSPHFRFFRVSMLRLSVLEIDKLLTKSKHHHYNLWLLLERITNGQYGVNQISDETLLMIRTSLNDTKETMRKVRTIRNKLIGHTDSQYDKSSLNIEFQELEKLLMACHEIVKALKFELQYTSISDKTPFFDSKDFDIIRKLLIEKRARIDRISGK